MESNITPIVNYFFHIHFGTNTDTKRPENNVNLRQAGWEHDTEEVASPTHPGPLVHVLVLAIVPAPQVTLHEPDVHSDHVARYVI